MREKVIVIRFPNWPRRSWLLALGGGILVLGAVAYAWAPFSLTDPVAGTPVSVGSIKANNAAITSKVTELQNAIQKPVYTNPSTGKTYSLFASYCGSTATTTGAVTDGALSGIPATKSLCEKACSNSPSAHMCTTLEVQRFLATGGTFPARGWYSAGLWTSDVLGGGAAPGARVITDCNSWTDATPPTAGSPAMGVEGPVAYVNDPAHGAFCNSSYPLLCCD
jgi:hypothetical protein